MGVGLQTDSINHWLEGSGSRHTEGCVGNKNKQGICTIAHTRVNTCWQYAVKWDVQNVNYSDMQKVGPYL